MKNILKQHYTSLLLISLFSISIIGFLWSYINHTIILYGDATSHLNIARRIVDSKTPGFAQLGSSWLPLFHVLLIPFAANNFLYRSGIAGYCVNGFLFIFSGYFFSKILLAFFPKQKITVFFITILFSLNSNLLYFQTTAMGEMLFVATSIAGIYYVIQYIKDINSTANLALSAFFVFLSSLNRYEGWFLAITETIFIFLYIVCKYRTYRKAEGKTILFGILAFLGIVTWLVYNLAIFHDPLNFIHDTYTAAGQQKVLYAHGLLQTKHNLLRSIQTFSFAIYDVIGSIGIILSVIALGWYIFFHRNERYLPVILFFSSIIFFEILTLYLGITAMYVEQLYPFRLFNVRYALFVYPGVYLLVGLFILSQKRKVVALLLVCFLAIQTVLLFYPCEPTTITEGKNLYGTDLGMIQVSVYLHSHYNGGTILAASGAVDPIFLFSDIPVKDFIYEGNRDYWQNALITPQAYAKWVVFTDANNALDLVAEKLQNTTQFKTHYRLQAQMKGIHIYERIR